MLIKTLPPSHFLLVFLVIIIWGFNFVVIKTGLDGMPALFLAFARFFLGSIPIIFFVKRPAIPMKQLIWYGLIMFALQFGLLFLGMQFGISPGLASLVMQVNVFFTFIFAVLFLQEKIHVWQIVGGIVSFSGIGLVGVNLGGDITFLGLITVLASAATWGYGNILSKKLGKVDRLSLIVWGSLIAWPPLLLLSFIFDGPEKILNSLQNLTLISTGSVLYITYLSTLFGFGMWVWLIHHHPISTIAPFTLLVPIVAILSSAIVLDEPLFPWKIIAGLLVIAGLCINLFGPKVFPKRS
jgi:O-acetylserine/cysteine efflux transporter